MPSARRFETIHRARFARHLRKNIIFASALVSGSLLMGTVGYHLTDGLPWIDSLLNASMILTGMGPVDQLHHTSAKLFATFYSLFSGVAFLTTAALLLIPVAHRVLHRFHIQLEEDESSEEKRYRKPAKDETNHP